jgi:RND superfamily putative drug exporter
MLVPAIMHTMGRRNWWLPERLGRRLPHLDIEGQVIAPPQRTAEPPRELVHS